MSHGILRNHVAGNLTATADEVSAAFDGDGVPALFRKKMSELADKYEKSFDAIQASEMKVNRGELMLIEIRVRVFEQEPEVAPDARDAEGGP